MSEADYYPAGAYSDANAPYNCVYDEDIYGDDAREQIKYEIKTFDTCFCEFVSDRVDENYADRVEMPDDIYSKEWEKWYGEQDCGWRDKQEDAYYDYRFDDVVAELAESASEAYDEDMRDYYEDR